MYVRDRERKLGCLEQWSSASFAPGPTFDQVHEVAKILTKLFFMWKTHMEKIKDCFLIFANA